MKSIKLAISEIFFSIQGEGKTVGIPSVFVRLGGCNLICGGEGTQNTVLGMTTWDAPRPMTGTGHPRHRM